MHYGQAGLRPGQLTSWNLQSLPDQLQIPWIVACPAHSFQGANDCSLAICKPYAGACSEAPHPTAGCMYLHIVMVKGHEDQQR